MRIGFIGGGVMAEAMIGGIIDAGLARPEDIGVGEPLEARRRHLADRYGLAASGDNSEALEGAEMAILAVKPQSIREALADIRPSVGGCVVMSIAAGVRMATLAEGLGHPAVIRVMPNTPAQIGKGMTVWTAAPEVPAEAVDAAGGILGTLGDELYVGDEKLIDMATALSASGPAYVFLFVESLIDAGVYLGMPRDVARRLALQTVAGSVSLLHGVRPPSGGAEGHGHLSRRHDRGGAAGIRARRLHGDCHRRRERRLREVHEPWRARLTSLLANFVTTLVWALNLAILGRVVLSWISPSGNDPVTPILYQITEPILAPIRRFMPQFGMLDLTPMVALLLLNVIIRPLILRLLL